MSLLPLKYLKDKKYIKHDYYAMYKQVSERLEDMSLITERNCMEIVNEKLIH